MARDNLFDNASLVPDDRNFEQTMADLNVPIERFKRKPGRPARVQNDLEPKALPATQLADVTWIRKTGRNSPKLGDKISINKYSISIGQVAAEKIARAVGEEIKMLGFGVTPCNKGQLLVSAVNDLMGFELKKGKSGAIAVASKTVVDKLLAVGLTYGHYRLDKQFGTLWTAVPEGRCLRQ